ncbi:MAG: WYL domain-containing protein [Eubacteriales bacterium]
MLDFGGNKSFRLLSMYEILNKGEDISKTDLAQEFNVSEKTIGRDIDDLRSYLAETHQYEDEVAIKYDKTRNIYRLIRFQREWLTNQEVLAVCKVLLESRAFNKRELDVLLEKMLSQVTPTSRELAEKIIKNEQFHYTPVSHGKDLISSIWELSNFITQQELIEISYTRIDGVARKHEIKPVAVMFSEYYFYLIAFMADDRKDFPTVFRIDRITDFKGLGEKFHVPYTEKFSDGEFRNRVQFMYAGALRTVNFEYHGQSVEAVLDRLPTAQVLSEENGVFTLKVEVYGNGIDMWLRSQGEYVKIL